MATSQQYIDEMIGMTEKVELTQTGKSEVAEFFEGRNIFVTGGSGFIGMLLIEKLLRCCPNLGRLYIMFRAKRGKSPEERFKKHFDDALYERLRKEQPDFATKVMMIEGDTGKSDLGLCSEDRDLIRQTVHIIFHCAATVRFDEKLRRAVNINVRGLKLILQLAKEMKYLMAFVHVSTSFSQPKSKCIEERFYPPPIEVDKLLNLLGILDDEALDHLTPVLLRNWPNTYAFSKAMAEETVRQYSAGIPICIVRPSIVISTWREPIFGWSNNIYGANGVAVGSGMGLLRTLHCKPDNIAEVIPADIVINNVVVAAWDIAKQWNEELIIEEPPIYNCVSSCQNPITWREFMKMNEDNGFEIPSSLSISYYFLILNEHLWIHNLCLILLHLIPAAIVDTIIYLMGKKPMIWKAYKKIHKFMGVIAYFSSQQWRFKNDANQKLFNNLNQVDREKFNFNLSNLDWDEFYYYYLRGLRWYLLKDSMDNIAASRIRYKRLKYIHYTIITLSAALLVWIILSLLYTFFSLFFH